MIDHSNLYELIVTSEKISTTKLLKLLELWQLKHNICGKEIEV